MSICHVQVLFEGGVHMAKPILDDELWELIKPLIPRHKRRFRYPGRKPLDHRKVLTGIVFILRTGIPWEELPQEMGCGCGMTCWKHLKEWQEKGVWQKIHELLLAKLRGADAIDWSRALVDSASIRAVLGGRKPAQIPRIDANLAVNTTSSPTATAFRWPSHSPGLIATT